MISVTYPQSPPRHARRDLATEMNVKVWYTVFCHHEDCFLQSMDELLGCGSECDVFD